MRLNYPIACLTTCGLEALSYFKSMTPLWLLRAWTDFRYTNGPRAGYNT